MMQTRSHCHEGHCGCHAHEKAVTRRLFLSFLLLIAGWLLDHAGEIEWFVPSVRMIWYAVAFLPVGLPVMCEAFEAARQRDWFNEFSLMSIAAIGAFCIGEYPEAVSVMLFYTVGELLQHKAVDRATRNIGQLLDVRPERTEVWRDGVWTTVSPREVKPGEQIEIKPGGRVPLDGTLQEKEAVFDTSALTGESMPRTLRKGDEVLAGMIAEGQVVHVNVCRPYEQSALARILALVKDASERKAPAELFIRKFARIYTPVVTLLAVCIVVLPALVNLIHPAFPYVFTDWLYRGLVFLVISCPCALVISIPLGYFGGIGAASRAGILFKGGNYLDAITRVNTIAFDKTGTLTTGRFEVADVQAQNGSVSDLLACVAALEQKSMHPIAQAILRYVTEKQMLIPPVSALRELAGHGLEAQVGERQVFVGNLRFMRERGIDIPKKLSEEIATVVVCAIDGKYAGHLLLSDRLKPDAAEAIDRLKQMGMKDIRLLSGDKPEIVTAFANQLGINKAYGNLLPEDKAEQIRRLTEEPGRSVAFVGDGMNDAPVLALSHVGIAMGGLGSDAAIESADVVLQNDQPSKVAIAIRIGRATRAIVRQNIVGALGIKILVLLAGALGYATLWAAVFADVGVALLAVLNAVRILYKRF